MNTIAQNIFTAYEKAQFRRAMRNIWFSRGPQNFLSVSPPTRPSPADIRNYDSALRSVAERNTAALVLGATPELRTVAAGIFRAVYVADFSDRMIATTQDSVPENIRKHERIIISDWQNLRSRIAGDFDAVLGDSVVKQIHYSERERFIANIASLVRPGGYFLTRIRLRSPKWAVASIGDILKEGLSLATTGTSGADRITLFRLYDAYADDMTQTVFLFKHKDAIRRAVSGLQPEDQKAEVIHTILAQSSLRVRWSHIWRKELERITSPYFRIAGEYQASDYEDADVFSLILFQKNA